MHQVPAFAVDDPGAVLGDLLDAAAATLVTALDDGLESTILPMRYDPTAGPLGALTGHVARANPLARAVDGTEALVVVTGSQGYITPSWYPSKVEHGRVVPTWDYVTVQAGGPVVFHDDPGWLLRHLDALTDHHESSRPAPWAVSDAPPDFVTRKLRGVIGIEIPLTRLDGKAKLSQNRPDADVDGVVAGLLAEGTDATNSLAVAISRARVG